MHIAASVSHPDWLGSQHALRETPYPYVHVPSSYNSEPSRTPVSIPHFSLGLVFAPEESISVPRSPPSMPSSVPEIRESSWDLRRPQRSTAQCPTRAPIDEQAQKAEAEKVSQGSRPGLLWCSAGHIGSSPRPAAPHPTQADRCLQLRLISFAHAFASKSINHLKNIYRGSSMCQAAY